MGTTPSTSRASAELLQRGSSVAADAGRPVSPTQNGSEDSAVSEAAPTSASRAGLCLRRRGALPFPVSSANVTDEQTDQLVYDLYGLTEEEIKIEEAPK